MKTFAIVPVKRFENGKTRLAPILGLDQRISLLQLLLEQTIKVLKGCQAIEKIILVSGDPRVVEVASKHGIELLYEEKDEGVNSAVRLADNYSVNSRADATIVVPIDLPFLQPDDIQAICRRAENVDRCVVISPALRYDGTNILLRKPPDIFSTHYDDDSYKNHVKNTKRLGAYMIEYLSETVMSDVDTPEDARQVLDKNKRGTNRALDYLERVLKPKFLH